MNSSDFNIYKNRYRSAIRKVLAESERGRLDEAGFPAYSHPNPIINWLFWQRLHIAMKHIELSAPHENILDFGCGSGVMLPFLAQHGKNVLAIDIDILPFEKVKQHIPFAANVKALDANQMPITQLAPKSFDLINALDANQMPITQLAPKSFDLINALDVLEHVDNLHDTLSELLNLLKPGGQLVVSGPTENILYQVGRKLAGNKYSGEYHERGIDEIKHELSHVARVEHIATLYWPIPLFEIFVAYAS